MPESRREQLQAEVGGLLRLLRRKAGLSSTQLAERVGYSQSKVSRMESGQLWPPRADLVAYLDAVKARGADRQQVLALADTIDKGPVAWQ